MSLKVMISSTQQGLRVHREAVADACLRQKMVPLMMEHLAATEDTPLDVSLSLVDKADVYIGLVGYRYGTMRPGQRVSITEEEYERARQRSIHRLIFVIDQSHSTTIEDIEHGHGWDKLQTFRERLLAENTVNFFRSPDDLKAQVINSLAGLRETDVTALHFISDAPRPPEPYIAHPYTLLETRQLIGRLSELDLLGRWAKPGMSQAPLSPEHDSLEDARVFLIVAIGGMGKSAVTWKWFCEEAAGQFGNLAGSVWWSFYESDAHFDNFINRTLAYIAGLRENDVQQLSPTARVRQLLHHLDERPFLLVLDGLERILLAYSRLDAARLSDEELDQATDNVVPLRRISTETPYTLGSQHRLRKACDPRAGSFLRALTHVHASRVVITSRLLPAALVTTAEQLMPGTFVLGLRGLAPDDAVLLWHSLGASGSTESLTRLFESIDYHPLLIQALAREVNRYRRGPGDFQAWRKDHPEFDPFRLPLVQRKSHVLGYALQGLGVDAAKVLETIAAFRMPVTYDTLAALLVGEERQFNAESALDLALSDLEDRGLLGWDRRANRYDLHPIVRGVTWNNIDQVTQMHVYESLSKHFEALPTRKITEFKSFDDLTADIERFSILINLKRYDDAYALFSDRLRNPLLFQLAANRQCAELLSGFLGSDGSGYPRVSAVNRQSYILNSLGLANVGLGNPERASELFELSNELDKKAGDALGVTIGCCNRAHCLLMTGRLKLAADQASLAIGARHEFFRGMAALEFGLTAAARGQVKVDVQNAMRVFSTINGTHIRLSDTDPLVWLYFAQAAIWSNHPADALVLANRAWELVQSEQDERLFLVTLRIQGAAYLATYDDDQNAEERLHAALARARRVSWAEDELATLICVAELSRRQGDPRKTRELLDEALDIGERGSYRLLLADSYLLLYQLESDSGHTVAASEAAKAAYKSAWCEGPPWAYESGLRRAQASLSRLGLVGPHMPSVRNPS
jgi:tetratricopeptide (TPR) repeat protein